MKRYRANPVAGTTTARGVPARTWKQGGYAPLDWAKTVGLPTSRPEWKDQASEVIDVLSDEFVHLGQPLGCGSFGCAYPWLDRPEKVIKITGDPSEAASAQRVNEGRAGGKKVPGVAEFFGVYAIRGTKLYVVTVEKLFPLQPNEVTMLKQEKRRIADVSYESGVEQKKLARELSIKYRVPEREILSIIRVFYYLDDVGVDWPDLHEGNVLRDAQGHLKVIDLGISYSGGAKIGVIKRARKKK